MKILLGFSAFENRFFRVSGQRLSLYSTIETNISASGSLQVVVAFGGRSLRTDPAISACTSTHSSELNTADTSDVISVPEAVKSFERLTSTKNTYKSGTKCHISARRICGCHSPVWSTDENCLLRISSNDDRRIHTVLSKQLCLNKVNSNFTMNSLVYTLPLGCKKTDPLVFLHPSGFEKGTAEWKINRIASMLSGSRFFFSSANTTIKSGGLGVNKRNRGYPVAFKKSSDAPLVQNP